jgi:hypothetical protein
MSGFGVLNKASTGCGATGSLVTLCCDFCCCSERRVHTVVTKSIQHSLKSAQLSMLNAPSRRNLYYPATPIVRTEHRHPTFGRNGDFKMSNRSVEILNRVRASGDRPRRSVCFRGLRIGPSRRMNGASADAVRQDHDVSQQLADSSMRMQSMSSNRSQFPFN